MSGGGGSSSGAFPRVEYRSCFQNGRVALLAPSVDLSFFFRLCCCRRHVVAITSLTVGFELPFCGGGSQLVRRERPLPGFLPPPVFGCVQGGCCC